MAKDIFGKEIKVGDCVLWHDPDEDTRDLNRVWGIDSISSDEEDAVVLISDDFSEAEVYPYELELYY